MHDRPAQAAWLSPAQRGTIETTLQHEQQQLRPVPNYATAFRIPMVMLLTVQYFCWSVGVYGFVIWLPSMLKAGRAVGIV